MSSLNQIPRGFKILSMQPELRIRFSSVACSRIVILLLSFPLLLLCAAYAWSLMHELYKILSLLVFQGIHGFNYETGDSWHVTQFALSFFGLGLMSLISLWFSLGFIEFKASRDLLTVSYVLLGMSFKTSILAKDIYYFNQFIDESSEVDSWNLEIVTNHRKNNEDASFKVWMPAKQISEDWETRMIYKTTCIPVSLDMNTSTWLGSMLADFYRVRFQSILCPKNPASH